MIIRKLLIIIYFLFFSIALSIAQDVSFMLYSNTSLNINPAMISASDDFKVSGSYKNTSYINNINAQSAYVMLSRPLYKNNKRFGGFGFSVISDKIGDIQQLSYEGITAAYAHEVKLTSWSRLSLGLQASYLMKRIGTREFSTGSQWIEGSGYDPSYTNGENYEKLTVGNFTLNSGLYWYVPNKDRSIKAYFGFAIYNLTKPTYSFFGADIAEPFKYVANAGYEVYKRNNFSIMPQILYSNSYYQHNWIFGSKWSYHYKTTKENWLFSSGSIDLITDYKINEGIALGIQVTQPGYSFGIGYGFADNFSGTYTPEKGTVEISLSIKKSLFREPVKKIVESNDYYKGQDREFVFDKPYESENKKETDVETIKEVKKELRRESSKEIKFKLEKDFQFGFNEAVLNDEAKKYINDIVLLLKENDVLSIEIIGHTDNVGTRSANQLISDNRAKIVKDYLIEKGINETRIKTRGMADMQPVFDNDTEEHRSKNRRVEFLIYY
ncbi:MAG: PorP/SprF family type IX secretion system membrane protein [Bacteroidales bacterium]